MRRGSFWGFRGASGRGPSIRDFPRRTRRDTNWEGPKGGVGSDPLTLALSPAGERGLWLPHPNLPPAMGKG